MAGSGFLATVVLAAFAVLAAAGGTRLHIVTQDERVADGREEALQPASGAGAAAAGDEPCGRDSDEICILPGLNGNPHVRMRSGYITVSEVSNRQLWYLVADRERDAALERPSRGGDAPVVLWLTGGPGCSSLDAMIYEHGPFLFSYAKDRQEDVGDANRKRRREVVIEPNPYSWTKIATMIYVDSPAGAGMSFSDRPDVDYYTNDNYTIADLVRFLEGLTARYPELATAPFYLSGESYGGVYVPLLAAELVKVNKQRRADGSEPLVNLKGYAMGNPVTDDEIDGNAQMFFAADMGMMDPPTWRHARKACDDMFWNATPGTECYEAQSVVKDDLWDLNWYDILDTCFKGDNYGAAADGADGADGGAAVARRRRQQRRRLAGAAEGGGEGEGSDALARRFYWPFTARMGFPQGEGEGEGALQGQQGEPADLEAGRRGGRRLWGPWLRHVAPCMDRKVAIDWLNRQEVRDALHAAPLSQFFWEPCSNVVYYALDTMALVPVHEDLVREGLRALVYSGDHDMVVPHTGTRKWVYEKARLGKADGPLRPWTMHGQVAGWTARFSAGAGLRFATIKGAGHMVPQSNPREALHLLGAFLYDEEL